MTMQLSRHDVKIAILRAMDDGRERTASEIADKLNREGRENTTALVVSRHLRDMENVGLVGKEELKSPVHLHVWRKHATGKCPGCGRDVSFLIPGSVYRCPTCAK